MAKKFGKFLLFTAAASAAGAAAYYYLHKKDSGFLDETDEDYDDFSEDIEDENLSRTYVPLTHDETVADSYSPEPEAVQEPAPEPETSDNDKFTPLTEQVSQATENIINNAEESVEEFFDEGTEESEESVEESTEDFFDDEN